MGRVNLDMITEMHGRNLELKELTVSYNIIGINVLWDLRKFVKLADLEYFQHDFATCVSFSPSDVTGKEEANGCQDCHYCWIRA